MEKDMQSRITAQQAIKRKQQQERRQLLLYLGPAATWLLLFFMGPLLMILVISFLQRGVYGGIVPTFNIQNYIQLLDLDYVIIFSRSLWLAFTTTIICLLVGYPLAYYIVRQSAGKRSLLVLMIIIPFWTNFLVRTYAWIVLLRNEGVINTILTGVNLIDVPLKMLFTPGAVLVGMVYGFLPFMVLPIYANLEKFDFSLMEAAYDSGANDFQAFIRVMLPLTIPGIVAGSILVFIPSIGSFITPDILGGAKNMMIGNLIDHQFKKGRNWPFSSAISVTLMVIVSAATALYFRITGEGDRL